MIYDFEKSVPEIHPDAWVASNATLIGKVKLEQEISPETKNLRELESLESTDATLFSTENVSESSTDGAENSTDPQNEQSAANLQFLQERYNRIANAALEEGKLELAKDCYDSLAKILRLMK